MSCSDMRSVQIISADNDTTRSPAIAEKADRTAFIELNGSHASSAVEPGVLKKFSPHGSKVYGASGGAG